MGKVKKARNTKSDGLCALILLYVLISPLWTNSVTKFTTKIIKHNLFWAEKQIYKQANALTMEFAR